MKISWQTQENGETYISVKGENDDNPIGTCRKALTNGKFFWKIIPWFNTWGMDSRTFDELFDNDIDAGRKLAELYARAQAIEAKRLKYRSTSAEDLFDDVFALVGYASD